MNDQKPSEPIAPILALFGSFAVVLLVLIAPMAGKRQVMITPSAVPSSTLAPVQPTTVAMVYNPITVSAGEQTFQSTCAACHGFNARGVPGLGKPLVDSEFVNSQDDAALVEFLTLGRPATGPTNTTGVMMPPRGGNAALSETNLYEVVAYIRSINARHLALASAATPIAPTAVPTVYGPTLVPTDFVPPSLLTRTAPTAIIEGTLEGINLSFTSGETSYEWSCAGCHSLDGQGVPYVGPRVVDSELLDTSNDVALYHFLVDGRPFADPRQTYPHPARGVYPQLNDEQIRSLIAYLHTLPGSNG